MTSIVHLAVVARTALACALSVTLAVVVTGCGDDHQAEDTNSTTTTTNTNTNTNTNTGPCGAGFVQVGTLCMPDGGADGVPNGGDNCPTVSNPDQADTDNNGVGDACEGLTDDADGDGVPDTDDNCPEDADTAQTDHDNDVVARLTGRIARRIAKTARRHLALHDDLLDLDDELATLQHVLSTALRPPVRPPPGLPFGATEPPPPKKPLCADVGGFSLHAGRTVDAHDRDGLERLCRYGLRAPKGLVLGEQVPAQLHQLAGQGRHRHVVALLALDPMVGRAQRRARLAQGLCGLHRQPASRAAPCLGERSVEALVGRLLYTRYRPEARRQLARRVEAGDVADGRDQGFPPGPQSAKM